MCISKLVSGVGFVSTRTDRENRTMGDDVFFVGLWFFCGFLPVLF